MRYTNKDIRWNIYVLQMLFYKIIDIFTPWTMHRRDKNPISSITYNKNIREDPKIKSDKRRRSFSIQNRRRNTENVHDCQRSEKNRVGEVGCVTTRRRSRNAKLNRQTLTTNTIKRDDEEVKWWSWVERVSYYRRWKRSRLHADWRRWMKAVPEIVRLQHNSRNNRRQ